LGGTDGFASAPLFGLGFPIFNSDCFLCGVPNARKSAASRRFTPSASTPRSLWYQQPPIAQRKLRYDLRIACRARARCSETAKYPLSYFGKSRAPRVRRTAPG
jgi:hypothetical protein